MSYGFDGSTVVDELNRLANYGTYPPRELYKDTASAARAWAQARGVYISDSVTDTVGVLNEIFLSGSGNRDLWRDMAGVCNELAGTQRKEPAAALREIYS